jgi:hypothetical protein
VLPIKNLIELVMKPRRGLFVSKVNFDPRRGKDELSSRNEGSTACLYRAAQPMTDDRSMTAAQKATLKRLAQAAYELDAFKPNLTHTEADERIAMLTAKLKLLDGPPHTL